MGWRHRIRDLRRTPSPALRIIGSSLAPPKLGTLLKTLKTFSSRHDLCANFGDIINPKMKSLDDLWLCICFGSFSSLYAHIYTYVCVNNHCYCLICASSCLS